MTRLANSARKCNLTFCPDSIGVHPESPENHYYNTEQ
jgi:hypothetical protein